ncbi:MAG: hypothetical protein NTW87_02580 [Planctomycetota bacterium]|nr:hypothetical protein [Planctomycetota bacterium]
MDAGRIVVRGFAAGVAGILLAAGCAAGVEATPDVVQEPESGKSPDPAEVASLLGPDAARDIAYPWVRRGYEAACDLTALSPANVEIAAKPFTAVTHWTHVHKRPGIGARCVSISAKSVRPNFIIMLYPHRDEILPQPKKAPVPACRPSAVPGFEQEVKWPDCVDFIGLAQAKTSALKPFESYSEPAAKAETGTAKAETGTAGDKPVLFLSHFARDLEFKGRKLVTVEGGNPGGAFTVLMSGDTVNLSALVHPDMEYQVRAPARLTIWAPEAKRVLLEGRPVEFARRGESVVVTVTTRKVRYRVDGIAERIERKAAYQLGGTWSFLGVPEERQGPAAPGR